MDSETVSPQIVQADCRARALRLGGLDQVFEQRLFRQGAREFVAALFMALDQAEGIALQGNEQAARSRHAAQISLTRGPGWHPGTRPRARDRRRAIHTWPEYGFAAIDLFTCGDAVDPWAAFDLLKEAFQAGETAAMESGAATSASPGCALQPEGA